MKPYTILIPAYNAAATLPELLTRLKKVTPPPRQIVIIDDGSSDESAAIAENVGAEVIRLSRNHGKGYALRKGFHFLAKQGFAGYIICLDADLQHLPEYIPDFLTTAERENLAFVIGARRRNPGQMPLHRILSNTLTSRIISRLAGQKIADSQCGFRLIDSQLAAGIELSEDGFQMESEMIIKAGRQGVRIGSVAIPVIYNQQGSHIGNMRDTLKFIRLVFKQLWKYDRSV